MQVKEENTLKKQKENCRKQGNAILGIKNWRSFNVKKVFTFIFVVLPFLFFGCRSTTIGQSYDVVNANSRVIGKLETSIENFDRGIGEAVERSRRIEDELERVDYLFGQYERLVGGLRDEVNSLRAEIERLEKVRDGGGYACPSVSGH
jgi:hypothetical protein